MSSETYTQLLRRPGVRQFATFVVIGLTATATHAGIALAAHEHLHYPPLAANFTGYVCAFLISYFGNARLTFRRRAMHGPQFVRFMTISLTALALNQSMVYVLSEVLKLPFALSLIPAVVVIPVFSFAMSKIWAFSDSRYRPGQ